MNRPKLSRCPIAACVATALMLCGLVTTLGADPLPTVPPEQRGDYRWERIGMHDAGSIRTRFWNFGMVGDYPVDPLHVDLHTFHSVEAPIGSGMNYADGITPFVLARVMTTSGSTLYVMETGYRERQAGNPSHPGEFMMRFEPRPGYLQADYSINTRLSPAMSDDPTTWPPFWPDRLGDALDPGWTGKWNGYFGKGPVADQESFTVMDDDYYEFPGFHADSRDTMRGGLGLRIEVRGLQWSNPIARDVIFWHYDIVNEGTTQYDDNLVFGMYVDPGIGGPSFSCDGLFDSDDDNAYWDLAEARNLAYAWDTYGHGVDLSGSCSPTGYFGYDFVQTPGNSVDLIDNDRDGITDERQDGGAGTHIVGQGAILDFLASHCDTARFRAYYGRPEDRPAFIAGSWWTGDEDMDWDGSSDLGADGLAGTQDAGEADGQPTAGEPNFDSRDPDEADQLGLTGFKMNRIHAGPGSPPLVDDMVFYTDVRGWPQRLWQHFTATNPAARFDPALTSPYNAAFLMASGPFTLGVGETRRFSLALVYAPSLDSLRQTAKIAEAIHRDGYHPMLLAVPEFPASTSPGAVLMGNRPNPFQRSTQVAFALSSAGAARLEVYDLQGRVVAIRELGTLAAGEQRATFDAHGLSPGLYLYRLRMAGTVASNDATTPTGKMLVMR